MSNVSNWLRERCWGSPCFTDEHIEVLWERVVELETENIKLRVLVDRTCGDGCHCMSENNEKCAAVEAKGNG